MDRRRINMYCGCQIYVNNMNRLYRKEIKEFFSVLTTHHVAKLEKPDDSEFGK